jgi:hypothetical protein
VELVDRTIAVDDASDRIGVAADQAVDGSPHTILGKTTHFEQAGLQLLEISLKVTRRGFGHISLRVPSGSVVGDPVSGSVFGI